jgi:hypothetical protein
MLCGCQCVARNAPDATAAQTQRPRDSHKRDSTQTLIHGRARRCQRGVRKAALHASNRPHRHTPVASPPRHAARTQRHSCRSTTIPHTQRTRIVHIIQRCAYAPSMAAAPAPGRLGAPSPASASRDRRRPRRRDVGERLAVEVDVNVLHLADAEQAALRNTVSRRRVEQARLLFHRFRTAELVPGPLRPFPRR